MSNFFKKTIAAIFYIFASTSLFSAELPSNITPVQIEQFKSLTPAQQKSLAKSMGVDISILQSQVKKSDTSLNNSPTELEQYEPREIDEDIEESNESKTLKPFGYDVFANAPSSFAPITDVAIPESYIIGTGDTLTIKVFGKENDEFEMPVTRDGDVVIPRLGVYGVSGMSFSEVKAYLKNEIKKKIIGVDVVVTLSELRAIRVFVLGEAFKPGNYLLNSLSTITHAIFTAGGIREHGSLRNIQIKRAGKLINTLDLYDLLIRGDSSNDIMLKSGDVVFVSPIGNLVTVEGSVNRPAIYELKANETIGNVLNMAGGLLPSAYPESTIVERYINNLRSVINVDLTSTTEKNKKAKAGDVIRVMETSNTFQQSISVIGAVSRPGVYQWRKNQKIADLLPGIRSHLLEDADLNYGLIVRQVGLGRDIEVLQFSVKKAIANINSADNVLLKPLDKVLIFTNQDEVNKSMNSLNNFALTEAELIAQEKENAENKLENELFWSELNNASLELPENYTAILQTSDKNEQMQQAEERALSFFSRERLLAPVIKRLTNQAASKQSVQLVDIAGAVRYPGTYPLSKNGNIKDLITAAGGLLESAFLDNAELSRNIIEKNEVTTKLIALNLNNVIDESTENITLKSRDRLNVNQIPYWQEEQVVVLDGEFKFPGEYIIRRGETLSQVIERAGGFTKFANLDATLFTRETLKALESKNIFEVTEQLRQEIATKTLSQNNGQTIDYDQVNTLLSDLTKVKPIGRLVIDLPGLIAGRSNEIIMENGDTVFVGSKQNTINVVGQVHLAGSHLYENNLSFKEYIKLSGGLKIQADEDRIYIIKANGAVQIPDNDNWFSSSNGEIKPGDTVVVPLDTYFMEDITLWQTATQILYQTAIGIAAITRI